MLEVWNAKHFFDILSQKSDHSLGAEDVWTTDTISNVSFWLQHYDLCPKVRLLISI